MGLSVPLGVKNGAGAGAVPEDSVGRWGVGVGRGMGRGGGGGQHLPGQVYHRLQDVVTQGGTALPKRDPQFLQARQGGAYVPWERQLQGQAIPHC